VPDRGAVFAGVVLQKQALERWFDGGVEPAVVAQKNHAPGPVGVEPLTGPFVADADAVLFALDNEGAGMGRGAVVGGSVEKDPVDPAACPVREGIGFAEGDQHRLVGNAVAAVVEKIGGVAVLPVGGEVEGPQDDIDLMRALQQRLHQGRFPVEKEGEDRFGEDHQPCLLSDRLVDLFKDGSDLGT